MFLCPIASSASGIGKCFRLLNCKAAVSEANNGDVSVMRNINRCIQIPFNKSISACVGRPEDRWWGLHQTRTGLKRLSEQQPLKSPPPSASSWARARGLEDGALMDPTLFVLHCKQRSNSWKTRTRSNRSYGNVNRPWPLLQQYQQYIVAPPPPPRGI
jgi:hypothetical protein